MIKLEGVTYRYGSRSETALENVSLQIGVGEQVCIMGANGSGKSTLASLVAGLIKTDCGTVQIDVDGDAPLPVGILFQNPENQMVAVTVEKEIAFALENLGVPFQEMEKRIADTLKTFSIEHLRKRITSELSGGEKQRVALASVMIFKPPVLVLDEPDSFLDESGRRALHTEEERIVRQEPTTTLVRITQYRSVAARYQRLIVFKDGRLIADGDPQAILSDQSLCSDARLAFQYDKYHALKLPSGLDLSSNGADAVERIVADSISFEYPGSKSIFSDLSFSLSRGEIVGLIGPTGCGKTTLGQVIDSLLEPTSGSLAYLGSDGRELPVSSVRGKVTGLFQQPERQFFLPTCAEEVTFGPSNLGRPLSEDQVCTFFDLVGLDFETFSKRDPLTLSMGEKRRLAFAAVLSMSPQFVVFDEPTCGLDPEGVSKFVGMARALKGSGMGLVIISHDGSLIESLTDRVLYLDGNSGCSISLTNEFFAAGRSVGVLSSLNELGAS